MRSETDVIVAGAGPAGAIAALVLARAGTRVMLIDRARFPRDKLCGDTVNPGALAILQRLGIESVTDGALPVDGMIVTDPTGVRCSGVYGEGRQGRALSRRRLDAALLAAASKAGACIAEGMLVQSPIFDGRRVAGLTVGSSGRYCEVRARMVIAADGANSRIARTLRLSHHADTPRRWAVGAYFTDVVSVAERIGDPAADAATGVAGEMHLRENRYVGVAPLPDGITNACVVTADRALLRQPAQLLRDTLRTDPLLASRFARARQITDAVCLGPLAVDNVAGGVPGLLLAGDAAGFVDPMTGDGLRFAFRGGELAAEAALAELEHGGDAAHRWLFDARRREFAPKWRFNRTLRALAGSPSALRAAGRAARLAPALVARTIRYAGDVS
jgi:flavin-dependent dehydrogenase